MRRISIKKLITPGRSRYADSPVKKKQKIFQLNYEPGMYVTAKEMHKLVKNRYSLGISLR